MERSIIAGTGPRVRMVELGGIGVSPVVISGRLGQWRPLSVNLARGVPIKSAERTADAANAQTPRKSAAKKRLP
jgi:hypothetical protein